MSEEMKNSPPQPTDAEPTSWSSPFDNLLNQEMLMPNGSSPSPTVNLPNPIFGTPDADGALFPGQQSYPDTCAIRCQEFVLEQFTGTDYDETALVQQCADNGWYTPGGGTSPQDVGNLLELHGIAVNRYENANIFHLTNELAQGHKVIIGVDSGELWNQHPILEQLEDAFQIGGADHAVIVSGIDTSDPNQTRVIVSDPGTGEAVASYSMDKFLDAWQDSNFFMVATQESAPSHLPEMSHFDYDAGHLEYVNGIPYQQFLDLEHRPELWDELLTSAPDKETLENALVGEDASNYLVSDADAASPGDDLSVATDEHEHLHNDYTHDPDFAHSGGHHSQPDPETTDDPAFLK